MPTHARVADMHVHNKASYIHWEPVVCNAERQMTLPLKPGGDKKSVVKGIKSLSFYFMIWSWINFGHVKVGQKSCWLSEPSASKWVGGSRKKNVCWKTFLASLFLLCGLQIKRLFRFSRAACQTCRHPWPWMASFIVQVSWPGRLLPLSDAPWCI